MELNAEDMDDSACVNLGNAIIMQAVKDYRHALGSAGRGNRGARAEVRECEEFFRSGWFGKLTKIDPEYLIKRLKEEYQHG